MADNPAENSPAALDEEIVIDLTWQLLDEQLDDEGLEQLTLLLEHSEAARRTYLETVQMHVSLLDHFGRLPDVKELLNKALAEAIRPVAKTNRRPGDVDVAALPEIDATEPTGV